MATTITMTTIKTAMSDIRSPSLAVSGKETPAPAFVCKDEIKGLALRLSAPSQKVRQAEKSGEYKGTRGEPTIRTTKVPQGPPEGYETMRAWRGAADLAADEAHMLPDGEAFLVWLGVAEK